jgi:hypothetical protein
LAINERFEDALLTGWLWPGAEIEPLCAYDRYRCECDVGLEKPTLSSGHYTACQCSYQCHRTVVGLAPITKYRSGLASVDISVFIDTGVLREYVGSPAQSEKSSSGCVRFARLSAERLTRVEAGRYLVS